MDFISFQCSECDQLMKFSASRAGKKAQCTNCGAQIIIPNESSTPAPRPNEDDDEGPKTYELVAPPEEKKKPQEIRKAEKSLNAIEKKKKKLQNVKKWQAVQKGLALMYMGAWVWGIIFALHIMVLLFAATQEKEYNRVRNDLLLDLGKGKPDDVNDPDNDPMKNMPAPGDPETMDRGKFLFGLIAGEGFAPYARVLEIFLALASLGKTAIFLMGYAICLSSPPRFGARGQAKAMIFMGLVNAFIVAVFRLLPLVFGVLIVVPFFAPEIPMAAANAERTVPLHVFWSSWPAMEMLATLFFVCSLASEPVSGGDLSAHRGPFAQGGAGARCRRRPDPYWPGFLLGADVLLPFQLDRKLRRSRLALAADLLARRFPSSHVHRSLHLDS